MGNQAGRRGRRDLEEHLMTMRRALGAFALALLLAVGLAACGDDGGDEAEDTTTTTAEEETTTTEEEDEEFDPDAGGDDEEEGEDEPDEGEENSEEQSTFADDVTEQVTGEIDVPEGTPYSGYTLQFNDDESVEASFPDEWDYLGAPDTTNIAPGAPLLVGSEDIDTYFQSWDVSGAEVRLIATDVTDTQAVVEGVTQDLYGEQCDLQPTEELELEDDFYFGHVVVGLDCGGTETDYVSIAADRDGTGGLVLVGIQIANTADLEALEEILGTFAITQPG
jgi:predicted small lipoprotein YifL